MLGGIAQFANWTVGGALTAYYGCAAHRSVALLPGSNSVETRPLHLFRGMLHFEPAAPFLSTLRSYGFQPEVFRFSRESEANRLRQWPENTGDVIRRLIERPETVGNYPIFCGHSAGGFTVYALAALAKGGSAAAIREACPGLEGIPISDLQDLGARLSDALFVAVASPLHGVKLTRTGRCVNRFIVEPRLPHLLTGITRPHLERFYRRVGFSPDQVIDANFVSNDGTPSFHGGHLSKAAGFVIQSGMRVFSPFLDHGKVNDGIVPLETALLYGPVQTFGSFDHLELVEKPEAATALTDLIRRADAVKWKTEKRPPLIPARVS